jgi:hypothetical protein
MGIGLIVVAVVVTVLWQFLGAQRFAREAGALRSSSTFLAWCCCCC